MAQQLPVNFEFRANQTFSDFYPGSNQEIIYQLQKTTAGTGEPFIFLWGEKGHGKSHLLQACCQDAATFDIRAFYLDLAAGGATEIGILAGLEDYGLVCLDNVDSLSGRRLWEQPLFNFFNLHRDLKHSLILSASCPPNALGISLPDLLTRLNWGLTLKIQTLDDNDKIAALTHKAQQMGFEIAPLAARFLLTRYDRDLPSLWLMLDKLDKASLAAQRKLTIPFLKAVLD